MVTCRLGNTTPNRSRSTAAPAATADTGPKKLMLLIVGGIFQALAMVAIMVGQNVQAAASDARAETDHETLEAIHTLAAQSIQILEGQNKILALLQAQAKNV